MGIRYSVIIPAYNAEKTLYRCLDSLLLQKRDDIEIVVINDGSKDSTADVCRDYAEKYTQIRFIDKENGGVSSARNAGLDVACGEYVTFVDSDDFVMPEYFGEIDNGLKNPCDFLMFRAKQFDCKEYINLSVAEQSAENAEETVELLSKALREQKLNSPCNKVYRRDIIESNKIRFDERLPIGEDKVFVVQYVLQSKSAKFISDLLYCVSVENENSLSRKARPNLRDSIILEHELLFKNVESSDLNSISRTEYLKAVSYSYYRSAYTVISELGKLDLTKKERIAETRKICRRYAERKKCKFYNLKHRLVSLPVRLKLARVIDLMLRIKKHL